MSERQPQVFICVPCGARRDFRVAATNSAWWPRCEKCGKPMSEATPSGKPKPPPRTRRGKPVEIPGQMSLIDEAQR